MTVTGVIDCHVHLHHNWGDRYQCAQHLLRHADRVGVELMCLSMGVAREFYRGPTPVQSMHRHNDEVAEVIARWPERFVGLCYLNPRFLPQSLAEIDRRVAHGPFRSIKLLWDMHCDQPNLDPIAARAGELGAPIQQHTWIKAAAAYRCESEPWRLAALARRHPQTTFVAAHTGGNWELGLRQIIDAPNIIADICGGDPESGYVEMAASMIGAARVAYGSDAPGRSFASQLAKVRGADVPDADKQQILSATMRRVLDL
ncbi:MAG: amidohydrolase family protein [Armatimonadota bacterium]